MQQTCSSQELALPLEGFVKLPGLMNVTQLSRSTIYAEVKKRDISATGQTWRALCRVAGGVGASVDRTTNRSVTRHARG